ncbi:Aldehyde/histidinol dehydrogenase [Chaetomium fimeti]|uniref:Aldehyde/histidinol dehydrogenase n=1 Tax=Chaetomium fimeti TaxID=1854472 RepID=A0AAE0LN09_9PEZI|nr:Aldehyde/histidinol dehydrogenase [Chaetomium fimeti]
MPKPFSNIRSAAIDGRALNPIFRKTQLKQLHDVLLEKASDIQDAITADTGYALAEVQIEYCLAMRLLAEAYTAIDTGQSLRDEYAVSRGQNMPQAKEAVGIVVIHPAKHAFFSCLMSALVPALAAGNCVIVHGEQSLLRTPRLVLDLITKALDDDVFGTTTSPIGESDLDHPHIRVLQNGSESAHLSHHLVSEPEARVVAVVERDADLDVAARELVRSRFALRGRSPYAPDLVLVNEWVKKEFLEAVVRHTIRFVSDGGKKSPPRTASGQSLSELVRTEKAVNVLSWSSAGAVVEVQDRKSPLLRRKVQEGCLLVHAVTSIDDAIDFSKSNGRLGAAYVFTKPSAAKYICQFLDSPMSFVNHVPTTLLFLPMAPSNISVDPQTHFPYDKALFCRPKACVITPMAEEGVLAQLLEQASPQQLSALAHRTLAKLPPVKRASQGITHIGFFQTGILTGGVLLLSTVLGVTGVCSYYAFGLVRSRVFQG